MNQSGFVGPAQWLALLWFFAALLDVGVLILCFTEISPPLSVPPFRVFVWTVGNVVAQFNVSILLGLGLRSGWYSALVVGFYLLVAGIVTWFYDPVAGLSGALVLGWGMGYHGILFRLLHLDGVRRGAGISAPARPWLRVGADALIGLGALLLIVYLLGLTGAA